MFQAASHASLCSAAAARLAAHLESSPAQHQHISKIHLEPHTDAKSQLAAKLQFTLHATQLTACAIGASK